MKINGEKVYLEDTKTLQDFLIMQGYNIMRTAVELNGDIVPRKKYADTIIDNDSIVEVVHFVGGG